MVQEGRKKFEGAAAPLPLTSRAYVNNSRNVTLTHFSSNNKHTENSDSSVEKLLN